MIAHPTERVESRTSGKGQSWSASMLISLSLSFFSGLIPELARLPMGNLLDRRLCRPGCDHVKATWLDQGWACGYKNFQMLLSSLRHDPLYSAHLFGSNALEQEIPSVSYLQKLIEKAWAAGFDSAGREQLNGRLSNSTKWIGPTEIMACLANLNVKWDIRWNTRYWMPEVTLGHTCVGLNCMIFISRRHWERLPPTPIYSNGFRSISSKAELIWFIHSTYSMKVSLARWRQSCVIWSYNAS